MSQHPPSYGDIIAPRREVEHLTSLGETFRVILGRVNHSQSRLRESVTGLERKQIQLSSGFFAQFLLNLICLFVLTIVINHFWVANSTNFRLMLEELKKCHCVCPHGPKSI